MSVPELCLGEDYWANMQILARILWSYNAQTAQAVMTYRAAGQPRSAYNAVHIRRGDKEAEAGVHHLQLYVDAIRRLGYNIRQIFVATDDIRIVGALRGALGGDYNVRSSSASNIGTGYDQGRFNSKSASVRRERILRFFSELEIMFSASYFCWGVDLKCLQLSSVHEGE